MRVTIARADCESFTGRMPDASNADVARAAMERGGAAADFGIALLDAIGRPDLKDAITAEKVAHILSSPAGRRT